MTTFTSDIGMWLGYDKCAYIHIERGKKISLGNNFRINDIEPSEIECDEKYKYLCQDEDIMC